MKNFKGLFVALAIAVMFTACHTTVHTVGNGSSKGQKESERQWYALFGLVQLNDVDSKQLAGSTEDYTITTQHTFVDGLISAFTGVVTISCQTVSVEK